MYILYQQLKIYIYIQLLCIYLSGFYFGTCLVAGFWEELAPSSGYVEGVGVDHCLGEGGEWGWGVWELSVEWTVVV